MSSPNNNNALREALQSSLQDVLGDANGESATNSGTPAAAAASPAAFPSLTQQRLLEAAAALSSFPTAPAPFSLANLNPSGHGALPSFLHNTLTAAADLSFHGFQQNQQALPLAAESSDYLGHARAALLKQQLIAQERQQQLLLEEKKKLLLQDSYLALLQGMGAKPKPAMGSAPAPAANSQSMALDMLLNAQASAQMAAAAAPSQPNLQTSLLQQFSTGQQQKQAPNALEALGSSLRSKNDPYIDVSTLQDPDPKDSNVRRTRGGVSTPFPEKLHMMLAEAEREGKTDVVSFFSHGRAFGVHDPERFVAEIMPKYFKQSKWNSFARQLNLYGFIRITSGPDAGGYYHELFLKGRPNISFHMRRVGVPQGPDRRKQKSKQEAPDPDFYSMKPVTSL